MVNRQTEIEDCEIDDTEEFKDEVFLKLSDALLDEKRLMKRFYDFCEEYNNFEFDEMGINMEEADDILRKANKIRDLILMNIENKLFYIFSSVKSNEFAKTISMHVELLETNYKVIIEVKNDSFILELV